MRGDSVLVDRGRRKMQDEGGRARAQKTGCPGARPGAVESLFPSDVGVPFKGGEGGAGAEEGKK